MFDATINALPSVLAWFGRTLVAVLQAMWDVTIDLIVAALDLFFLAIGALISSAPASQLLTQYSLQLLIGQVGSDILYFVPVLNIPQGLTMLSAGVIFRLFVRRLFMLDQW